MSVLDTTKHSSCNQCIKVVLYGALFLLPSRLDHCAIVARDVARGNTLYTSRFEYPPKWCTYGSLREWG